MCVHLNLFLKRAALYQYNLQGCSTPRCASADNADLGEPSVHQIKKRRPQAICFEFRAEEVIRMRRCHQISKQMLNSHIDGVLQNLAESSNLALDGLKLFLSMIFFSYRLNGIRHAVLVIELTNTNALGYGIRQVLNWPIC